jgi:predicted heme/steroid binding protein/uncharacterized membrane protein
MAANREFTLKELARHDGEQKESIYIAFEGEVYDLTDSPLWKNGLHLNQHHAGTDLTDQLAVAPHWGEVFTGKRVRRVGSIAREEQYKPLPAYLKTLFRAAPMLRRHLHPITAHFPTAYLLTAALFSAAHLARPGLFGLDFELAGLAMVVLATAATVAAVGSGFLTLWVNYKMKIPRLVKRKIAFTAAMAALEVFALALRAAGPLSDWRGAAYHGSVFLMAAMVVVVGYLGGQMVFPTKTE